MDETLALFPLHTVLLPGGSLDLRVFEPRYLDLVGECGRHGRGFGVCMIVEGEEAGAPATPAAWGTAARIEDFGSDADGVLTLRVRGQRRFHVRRTRVRDNGLLVAEVEWRDPEGDDELRPEHALLAQARPGDHVVFMSNGGFENAPRRFANALRRSADA